MITAEYCQTMAAYNEWMNLKIYGSCKSLSDGVLNKNVGMFFDSIFKTLNHIMYGDLALISRISADWEPIDKMDNELYKDFSELYKARQEVDRRICLWADRISEAYLQKELTYISNIDGLKRTVPYWFYITHIFNHQTHHRGQITTVLCQLGIDIGPTDITFMDSERPE